MKRYSIEISHLILFFVVFISGVTVGMEEGVLTLSSDIDNRMMAAENRVSAALKILSEQDKKLYLEDQFRSLQDRCKIIEIDFKFIQDSKKWVCTFLEEGYQHWNRHLINPDVLAEVKNQLESLNAFEYLNMKKLESLKKELNELRAVIK